MVNIDTFVLIMSHGYKISVKTTVLNFFRRVFKFSVFENLLAYLNTTSLSILAGKLISPPYLYQKGSFREVIRNGINFKLDISDTVDHFIFFNYFDHSLELFFEDAKTANVILDIGANIGWTALNFANKNPKATIIAFEPHPLTFQRAQDNFGRNNFSNITCLNIGLGESPSTLKIYELLDNNSGMNRIVLEELDRPFKEVKIERLDDVLKNRNIHHVDLIKMDVEGFEGFVLKGASKILTNSNAKILMETDDGYLKNNGKSARELIDILKGYGYQTFYRSDKKCFIEPNDNLDGCHFDMLCSK
jgi:FkbM family methyltransferase